METQDVPTQQDKQITVDVPEHRVAEFYAFYARFLAGRRRPDRRRRGHGCREGHGPLKADRTPDAVQEA